MPDTKSILVCISGRVQGVGYRAWTAEEAERLKLSGWVRNLQSGDVEAAFSGPAAIVEAMLEACWQGPPHARVDNIAVSSCEPATGPFAVRYER